MSPNQKTKRLERMAELWIALGGTSRSFEWSWRTLLDIIKKKERVIPQPIGEDIPRG
jgi:hypothetical protein